MPDPPGCGCGLMSVERVYALFEPSNSRRSREAFRRRQLILFPSLTFSCSGKVLKWFVASRRLRWYQDSAPQLQLWRQINSTIYGKLNSTVIFPESEENDDVYEIVLDTGVVVQPGDFLGMYIPARSSRLKFEYDEDSESLFYTHRYSFDDDDDDDDDYNDINVLLLDIVYAEVRRGLPLVSVEFGEWYIANCYV